MSETPDSKDRTNFPDGSLDDATEEILPSSKELPILQGLVDVFSPYLGEMQEQLELIKYKTDSNPLSYWFSGGLLNPELLNDLETLLSKMAIPYNLLDQYGRTHNIPFPRPKKTRGHDKKLKEITGNAHGLIPQEAEYRAEQALLEELEKKLNSDEQETTLNELVQLMINHLNHLNDSFMGQRFTFFMREGVNLEINEMIKEDSNPVGKRGELLHTIQETITDAEKSLLLSKAILDLVQRVLAKHLDEE